MQNKEALVRTILVSVSIFCIISIIAMFRHLKKAEFDFNDKRAGLIKENMELKDEFESLRDEFDKKTETFTLVEEENKRLKEGHSAKLDALTGENISLTSRIKELEEKPLVERLRDVLASEEDKGVKEYLEKVLYNILLLKSGENIEAEPVVAKKDEKTLLEPAPVLEEKPEQKPGETQLQTLLLTGIRGRILSIDKKHNLIVIDLGRYNDIRERQRCIVLKSGEEIASAKIISVRYKVSAAFIDEIKYKYTIRNIEEGDEVLIVE